MASIIMSRVGRKEVPRSYPQLIQWMSKSMVESGWNLQSKPFQHRPDPPQAKRKP